MVRARFDDLRPEVGRSFALAGPAAVLETRQPDEVAHVLDAAEAAAGRGLWAAGVLAYEAGSGLDPHQTIRSSQGGTPFDALPLVWFGLFERLEEVSPLVAPAGTRAANGSAWRPSVARDSYDRAIASIRERIAAGETYQVNHTFRLRATVTGNERVLYRDLCLAQRGGYCVYLDLGRYHVLSASPELFFRLEGDRITTRPMKGTATRGRWLEEDEATAAALVASGKDRAENAMIVDLLRNDLGRIAVPGSVTWEDLFRAERYETVWQLTSEISADVRPGTSLREIFRALFPSGSVTGAPKLSTMAIIAGLEDSPRGVYCGAVGLLAPPGSGEPRAHFNVAIRTVVVDTATGVAEYGTGGGVTFDSSAAGEYEEALAKARVLSVSRPAFELFETLRHAPDLGSVHLEEHLARMAASAAYFGFRFDRAAALDALARALGSDERGVRVRLTLDRGGRIEVELSDLPPPGSEPVRVALDRDPVDPSDVWLFHKTTCREAYDRRRSARPDVDDVLLTNTRGEVTESTIANVAVRLGGVWVTPPRDAGLLAGTYRAVLLREGRLVERPVPIETVLSAEEIALISSVRGWRRAEVVP